MDEAAKAYLAARKEARTSQESNDQPEQVEAVDVLESTPTEEVEQAEVNTDVENAAEVEESEAQPIETQEEEGELFYYEIDGEEVDSKTLKEWKDNGLMQADYTRKTQELSESRKLFEQEQAEFNSKQSKLSEQLATLEAMINEDAVTDEQLQEMREYEPEKYIEYIEKQSKRKDFLKEAKKNATPEKTVNVQEEQAKLIKANPQWLDNGKATKEYQKDMNALTQYYQDNGFTQEQVDAVNSSAVLAQAVIDAARFKSVNVKKAVTEKRVRKAPVSTKPKAQAKTALTTEINKLSEQVKKTGDPKLFQQLRKLQRQQKGN